MEGAVANALEVEKVHVPVVTLDKVNIAKLVKLSKIKVAHARTAIN